MLTSETLPRLNPRTLRGKLIAVAGQSSCCSQLGTLFMAIASATKDRRRSKRVEPGVGDVERVVVEVDGRRFSGVVVNYSHGGISVRFSDEFDVRTKRVSRVFFPRGPMMPALLRYIRELPDGGYQIGMKWI